MAHQLKMGDDAILRVAFVGDVGKEDIEAFIEDFTPFLEAAAEAEPLFVLMDVSQGGKASSAARKIIAELSRNPRLRKVGIVGITSYARVLAGFLNKATGRDHIHFFESEEKALAWLKVES